MKPRRGRQVNQRDLTEIYEGVKRTWPSLYWFRREGRDQWRQRSLAGDPCSNLKYFAPWEKIMLGRNMITVITKETCFAGKHTHIRRYITRIMIQTCLFWAWLKQPHEVFSIIIRRNKLKMTDVRGEKAKSQKTQNWPHCDKKCFVEKTDYEIWDTTTIIGRKTEF